MGFIDSLAGDLGTTPSTIVVGLVILLVCVLIVRAEFKRRKHGGACAGCAGCSSGSAPSSCPSCSIDVDALEAAVKKAEENGCDGAKRTGSE